MNEQAAIKVRSTPYIEDFGIKTSHTGKSAVVEQGQKLELTCRVQDETAPIKITWLRSARPDDERDYISLPELTKQEVQQHQEHQQQMASDPRSLDPTIQTYTSPGSIIVEQTSNFSKRLLIDQVSSEHRSYYICIVDNGVTEKSSKAIFIRVKDEYVALWPFLGILAEVFILFTIIHVWETQRAFKATRGDSKGGARFSNAPSSTVKRLPSGPTNALENVPLNR